jgi:hypothetical protein
MYSVEHNNVCIALVATSVGRYDHHRTNAIQNLKRLVAFRACNVKLYGIPFISMSIFVSSLKIHMESAYFCEHGKVHTSPHRTDELQ